MDDQKEDENLDEALQRSFDRDKQDKSQADAKDNYEVPDFLASKGVQDDDGADEVSQVEQDVEVQADEADQDIEVDEVDSGVRSQTSTKFRHMLEEKPNRSRKYLRQIPKYG